MDVTWNGTGRIVAALVGGAEYFFVAGGLRGRPGPWAPAPAEEEPPLAEAHPLREVEDGGAETG
ncbi:hypothetical protein [Kitasatospora sp. NPDC001527]